MILLKLLEPLGSDFAVYYEAAVMFLQGLNPYQGLLTRSFPYNYPPTSLLFLWPIGFLDQSTANIVWNLVSISAVILSIWITLKIAFRRPGVVLFGFLCLIFTIPFFPVKFNIGNGQINHFLLLLFALAIYFYHTGRKNLSALFLAAAALIKIAPAVFALYWLIKQDWRQIIRFGLMVIAIGLLSLFFVPFTYQHDYFFRVLPLSFTLAAKDWYYNQSLAGFLARSFQHPVVILLTTYVGSLLIIVLTWLRGRQLGDLRLIAAVSSLYLIIHPIALQHYFGFAIIPLILLGVDLWRTYASWPTWAVLAVCYLLLAFDIKNFNLVPTELKFVLSHDFYGVFGLWLLALWKEKFFRVISVIWVGTVGIGYLAVLLCRVKICL